MGKENPADLKYSKQHEWVKEEGDILICGITDHAQELLTDIVFVELPEVGKTVKAGDPLAALESVKSVSDVYSPVSGEITEVNNALSDSPETVNQDAFGRGWIFKIKPQDKGELDSLLSAEDYSKHIRE